MAGDGAGRTSHSGPHRRSTYDEFTATETIGDTIAALVQLAFFAAGTFTVWAGFMLRPQTAIHEILQFNMVSGGALLFGVGGIWAAIDALRRRQDRSSPREAQQPVKPRLYPWAEGRVAPEREAEGAAAGDHDKHPDKT